MIHRLELENFYSNRDKNIIDFTVTKKAPSKNAYIEGYFGDRITKVLAVFGSNGSGKTNLLKSIPFLSWFISSSFVRLKADDKILVKPFLFGDSSKKPTKFFVLFEIGKKLFKYNLVLNNDVVLAESLYSKDHRNFKYIFKRTWDPKKKKNMVSVNRDFRIPKEIVNLVRNNCSLLSTIEQLDRHPLKEVVRYWRHIEYNLNEVGNNYLGKHNSKLQYAAKLLWNKPELRKEVENLICRFDVGLSGIKIEKEQIINKEGDPKESFILFGLHGKQEYKLRFDYESSGTKTLLIVLADILFALENKGSIAVLDEFDLGLHPHMVSELINLFVDKSTNTNNTQLIFSSHSVEMMNRLDKYQILLTEKESDGATHAFRLDSLGERVRSDDNYSAKYNAGAYGGVPNII